MTVYNADEIVNRRATLGWQCPECYGVQIEARCKVDYQERHGMRIEGFQCVECGCQWTLERV